MKKLSERNIFIILIIVILIFVGVAIANHFTQSKVAEMDARIVLKEMDSLTEYELPEGWEFKESSAVTRTRVFRKNFNGHIYIGKKSMGEVSLNNPIYECIKVNISNSDYLSTEENEEQAAINFGDSNGNYTFEETMIIDGETAYCGTINNSDTTEKIIVLTHNTWPISLCLTTEEDISEEQVDALYNFAKSIKFKN